MSLPKSCIHNDVETMIEPKGIQVSLSSVIKDPRIQSGNFYIVVVKVSAENTNDTSPRFVPHTIGSLGVTRTVVKYQKDKCTMSSSDHLCPWLFSFVLSLPCFLVIPDNLSPRGANVSCYQVLGDEAIMIVTFMDTEYPRNTKCQITQQRSYRIVWRMAVFSALFKPIVRMATSRPIWILWIS